MLNAVIRFSLQYRLLILLVSLAMLVYGSYLATQMPIDVFPDLDRPRVIILTECRGLATEEVETLVTQPIEIALLGASGVQAVRSQSTAGLAVIYIEFDWNTEIKSARQTVQERLGTLEGVLPSGVTPMMTPPSSIMGQIVVAGIYRQQGPRGGELYPISKTPMMVEIATDESGQESLQVWRPEIRDQVDTWKPVAAEIVRWERAPADSAPGIAGTPSATLRIDGETYEVPLPSAEARQLALRTICDWVIRPRILKVTGVAEAFILGGDRKQYQVRIDPTALLEYGVTLQEVEQAIQESNINTSGGFAVKGETERPIRILGRLGPDSDRTLYDLSQVPVKNTGERPILLEQVARVVEGAEFKRGDGSVNGRPGVVFTIVKQPHVDTRGLTDRLEEAFAASEESLPADIVINPELFQLRKFIDRGIFNVGEALIIGATLVIIILFLFLLNFRTTFITLTAIPLSLVITTFVFRLIGFLSGSELSINVMTLGGIAVAMGELVDDAIVDVENIFRRLKENNALEHPRPAVQVVYEASKEIRSAIVFGTAVVILVFLPLFALSGVEGRLFAPLGVAYIVSILASLLVSLTVTPVLSYYLLPQSSAAHAEHDGLLLRSLKWGASYLIRFSMAAPLLLLAITWIGVGFAGWELANLGKNFLPEFDEGSVQINVTLPPGSSLDASNQVSALIDGKIREMQKNAQNPDGAVLYFVRRTGRAEMDEHASPVNAGEYILSMNPDSHHERDEIIKRLLEELSDEVPGVSIEVEQPLAHLISHMVSGVYAEIAIKIFGDDIDKLRELSEKVKGTIQQIDGITPPVIEPIQQTEELQIHLRTDDLAFYGLTRGYVANVLQTALQGAIVSEVLEGQRRFDLLVRLEEEYRTDYANLGRLRIDLPNGQGQIELREIADVGPGVGPNAVNRENARRRMVIRCNTQGRDLASAVAAIQRSVDSNVGLPEGYFIEYGGQFESQQRATRTIAILAAVSVVGMFVVLMVLFPSVRVVLQILNALPTAFIGGVLALVITQQTLTVASLVGFISLGGIAVRNGILLVTHYFHLMKEEGEDFSQEMILRGSLERLAPVLMTALTAGIGLLPLVIGGQEPGREILYPVATVILGGLVTSTFCEFLIHPGIFWRLSGKDALRLARAEQSGEELIP
ncbi:efflux RND transporter permease subunit [Blastopirellula sp. JC732]|uniref:Efflux RND transporter permease subunit n=1 Tax=Blastopirellula sediminis TaxID=2894196 RepID=A0A9X1MKF6_9BACT|nr:efflux RND transporter permease subunit [Blastopirellula sediminis]MCC9608777.1 efflux RND transporter permease subunit [Blastopirellula sediminis]MCC9628446.1 efflux RND transporter permease subunit [Blastopirellula sediminis]